tara:strand:+ start:2366 stop:3286 length:921 start_codon:yes stop_codon:yes gene_type:complete
MAYIYLALILTTWSLTSTAQNYIDLIKFDYVVTPPNTFDSTSTSTTLQETNGDATIPIAINDNLAFLTGIAFENSSASFGIGRSRESMTGLTLKLGVNIKHNSKWSGTYVLLPKISSDLKKIDRRDFQFGAAVLMKYTKTSRFNYRIGLYGNTELSGPFIVPLFGLYYLSPSEKFEAKVLLPVTVDLNYLIGKGIRFGLNFKGQQRSYNMNSPFGSEANRYMERSTNELYAYFQYGTKSGLNFQLKFGRSVWRSYRIYDENVAFGIPLIFFGDNRTQLNTDFSDSWLFKIAVFYRLKLDTASESNN